MLLKVDTDIELLTFSDEARKSNKQLSDQGDDALDQDEEFRTQWYEKNSQYLDQVVRKGINEFVTQIDKLISIHTLQNGGCEERNSEILGFKQRFIRTHTN